MVKISPDFVYASIYYSAYNFKGVKQNNNKKLTQTSEVCPWSMQANNPRLIISMDFFLLVQTSRSLIFTISFISYLIYLILIPLLPAKRRATHGSKGVSGDG